MNAPLMKMEADPPGLAGNEMLSVLQLSSQIAEGTAHYFLGAGNTLKLTVTVMCDSAQHDMRNHKSTHGYHAMHVARKCRRTGSPRPGSFLVSTMLGSLEGCTRARAWHPLART